MKLRTKILLAIWGMVLGLLLATYVIINYWVRVQVESRFAQDLKSNYSAVTDLEESQSNEIERSCQIVAESPRLKAVVPLGDRNTADQLCQELNQSTKSDLFILTDINGKSIVELIGGQHTNISPSPDSFLSSALHGDMSTDVWHVNNVAYRCASVPIVIGPDRVGTLTLGFRIHPNDIFAIRAMTNSEVVLTINAIAISSTLNEDDHHAITSWLQETKIDFHSLHFRNNPEVFTIQTRHNKLAATLCRLNHDGDTTTIGLLLLKPIEAEVQGVLSPVVRTFIILSLVVLVVTAVFGFIISQGITRPIAALVKGTSEVSRGNYDFHISVGGNGEMKYLAQRFEEMSLALKEKISQLAERNRELETTLQQLKDTQAELVKSERLAVTGKLTAQLSHEINNPIHNIKSSLQTVLKRIGPQSPDHELLDVAYEEVERLANLTRQMLDVYRLSMAPLQRVPLNLNEVIQEVITSSTPSLNEKGVKTRLNLSHSLPNIFGSRDKLKQVFLNLIMNAQDAMPSGGLITIVSASKDGCIVVDVIDSGIGIQPEHINRIFDAFFTTKNTVSGVGLGLSVTYGIVKQHDGTISVQSTVGKGTTFSLSFPIIQS
ncbi:MAG TPA: ATP-binding protein [Bacteroidota bacterium]|nr:ATP-binding protein [Bacteroidota bacterium]